MSWYTPTTQLTPREREVGLKYMFYDGLCSHAMALLVAAALTPFFAPEGTQVFFFTIFMVIFFFAGSFGGCS